MLRRLSTFKFAHPNHHRTPSDLHSLPEKEEVAPQDFSASLKSKRRSVIVENDNESLPDLSATVIYQEEPLPSPTLKVKRVDYYYNTWVKGWRYRNMSSKVIIDSVITIPSSTNDQWNNYGLVLVRTIPDKQGADPTFKFVVKNPYIIKACKDVIQSWPGISWNSDPLELEPEIFIIFYQNFVAYRDALTQKTVKKRSHLENYTLSSVSFLLDTIARDFKNTLTKLEKLTTHAEIIFDMLYAILIPRTILVAQCAATGLPRAFYLSSFKRITASGRKVYMLECESTDMVDSPLHTAHNMDAGRGGLLGHNRRHSTGNNLNHSSNNSTTSGVETPQVGRVQTTIIIEEFDGTIEITKLPAYPIKYHPDEAKLREQLLQRGKKWLNLVGTHHMQYDGMAVYRRGGQLVKNNVRGRIMVDRATFRRLNPNYSYPVPVDSTTQPTFEMNSARNRVLDGIELGGVSSPQDGYNNLLVADQTRNTRASTELSEEDLLITSTLVYGFSLSDKLWFEFNIDLVRDVEWNDDAFKNLVLPVDRKNLLQSLVEAHHKGVGFDDFIKEKGQGLVVNLFGPPGVGKTFSAEATSEHVRRPLYVVSSGDLGTRADDLDRTLERIFDIATAWRAIVLIDEADVFLEKRSLHDLERNAMVAVFLRHVEYYRGILFMTTNRVSAFDEAFLSRIHVALHFTDLTEESKRQVWAAFISKLGPNEISHPQIKELAKREVNGRQIKNAVRTAQSLSVARGERIRYQHFVEALDAMEEFTRRLRGEMGLGLGLGLGMGSGVGLSVAPGVVVDATGYPFIF
ncbi:hypothetical protein AMATHDRAFT_50422 [Amanita thiersii Skay4041]|uniref:AAA+ ATPase domain-containing protein n=1 Tax=Amanita thiersii Skay4041 TaxID=703135 RepID=A0A2A9ND96_9AGAR|nr:hypothetical protein AMATHDRAFT_50422 [Amanita thiersii Skay4041]